MTDALTRFTESKFDAAGRLIATIDEKGRETKYQHDERGRLLRTTYADNTSTSSEYDAAGRVIKRTEQTGKVTQYGYNARGDLTSVTNPLNQTTTYGYDANRNLTSSKDAENRTTGLQYTELNQLATRTYPGGPFQTEVYVYDPAGNLHTKANGERKTTTYQYDELHRLKTISPDASLNEPALSFTYKANGQRWTMTDGSGTTTYGYDVRNRLQTKQTPFGTLTYDYDPTSNVKSVVSSNANGLSLNYEYDELNRLKKVTDNRLTPGVTNYQYDEVGNLKQTIQPNGVTSDYQYNAVNLLATLNVSKGASTLARYTYKHTPARLRESVTELNGRTVSYGYDDANQLTSETITGAPSAAQNGVVGYVLDAVGNRQQRNSTVAAIPSTANSFNANDHLSGDSYDQNGNTIAADGKTYGYDFRDRLKSVNGGQIGIGYDSDGQRVSKTVAGVTTNYLVDENSPTGYAQVVEELVGGQVRKVYSYGNMLISQRQLVSASWVASHYGHDGGENVRQLFDNAGAVTDTWDYDAFGIVIGRTGTTANSYLYRGQQFDADLGFHYQRARYYQQGRGRFLTRDEFEGTLSEPQSLHKYLYAHAEPVNNYDPSGFGTLSEIKVSTATLLRNSLIAVARGSSYLAAPAAGALYVLRLTEACNVELLASIIFTVGIGLTCATVFSGETPKGGGGTGSGGTGSGGAGANNQFGDELFYRAMSEKEYKRLEASGGNLSIRENRTELFVTRDLAYVSRLSERKSEFPIIVEFKRQSGTEAALIARGATHNSAFAKFPDKPHIDDVGENNPNYVQLKFERGALTFGLRHNTIGIFNDAKAGNPSFRRLK